MGHEPIESPACRPEPDPARNPLFPKIDTSLLFPKIDTSLLFPKIDMSLLFPRLAVTGLYPVIHLRSLTDQIGPYASIMADQDASSRIDTKNVIHRKVTDREVASALTVFVFLITCIGISIAVKECQQIAALSRITGASPFDIAMGFGALTFWSAYSRRLP